MSKNIYSSYEQRTPDCQDWTTVTMSKSKKQDTVYKATTNTQKSFSAVNSASAVVAATSASPSASASASSGGDGGDTAKKTKYVAKATSDTVRQARCDKKLTQKELAQKCNMDVSIVAEIERGGNCVYNTTHVNKIQSVLGVKIPRA
jgi:ribosome-binding protein aMBF1 (putative translation factor)